MAAKRLPRRRARGTGTIQKQGDGSYIARTSDRSRSGRFPPGPQGYREAEEALDLWNKQLGIGVDPNETRQKLRDFVRVWLVDVVAPTCRPRTLEFYRRHAGYATNYIGDLALEAVSTRTIEQMLGKCAADGLKPRSIDHIRAVLHNAFEVARRWYGLENPVALVPHRKAPERHERALSPEHVAALLAGVAGDRLEALYHVALTLGLRRGELLGLRWSDIDFEHGTLQVAQQVSEDDKRKVIIAPYVKSDGSDRLLPIPPDLVAQLRSRQRLNEAEARIFQKRAAERAEACGEPIPLVHWNPHNLVFCSEVGTVIQPSNFNRRFAALVKRLKLPEDTTPHTLRHTALTDLAAYGEAKAVQNIAGHASVSTTMQIYAGRRMNAMRAAVEAVEKARKTG